MPDQNDLYYETYREDEGEEELSPRKKLLRTTFRIAGLLLLAAVFIIFFWRFWTVKEPRSMTRYLYTEKALAAEKLSVVTQNLDRVYLVNTLDAETGAEKAVYVKRSEYYPYNDGETEGAARSDFEGTLKVTAIMYTPELEQLQITFRYNNRLLPGLLQESYGIFASAALSEEPLTLALQLPDGSLLTDYSYVEGSRSFYRYRRIVFEGVKLDLPETAYEPGGADDPAYGQLLNLNVYYNGLQIDWKNPFASMVVFDGHLSCDPVKLPAKPSELAALRPCAPVEEPVG